MDPARVIYLNVILPADAAIGEFVVIGVTPSGRTVGELTVAIGPGAVIRSHCVIYAGTRIGCNFQAGHGALIREFCEIGDYVSIGSHTVIEHHVVLQDGVRIHSGAFIPEFSILEAGSWIGPNVVFTNARYPRSAAAKSTLVGPRILEGARVGANATLLPGVIIGRESLVGAGAVVVENVPDFAVVVGNPSRVVNDVRKLPAYATPELLLES
ncbi:MAG: DapH/DapD/GlmU-related protein [Planctomycetota bacterium]|nr:DapH/DapD/GlmU-related protein [Planctomycetota bacterium]